MKQKYKITAVYQVVNMRTLKFYIGSAKDFDTRYNRTKWDWTKHHNTDIRKDATLGDSFLYCKIQECETIEEAKCMEQWWFDFYILNKMWDSLYNISPCAYKFCPIIGDKNPAKTPEARAKASVRSKGRKHSQETKTKISISRRGKCTGDDSSSKRPEVRAKFSAAQRGKHMREESKKKMAIAKTGDNNPAKRPEVRQKLRDAWTPERREALRILNATNNRDNYKNCKLKEKDLLDIIASNRTDYEQLAIEYNVNVPTLKRYLKKQKGKLNKKK